MLDGSRRWLRRGWKAYSSNALPLAAASLVVSICGWCFFALSYAVKSPHVNLAGIFLVVLVLSFGRFWMSLKAVRGGRVGVADLFEPFKSIGRYAATLLTSAAILLGAIAGFALLVIPALWWILRSTLAVFALVDEGFRPTDALKSSIRATRGHALELLFLWALAIFLNLLGQPFRRGISLVAGGNAGADAYQHLFYGVVPYLALILVIAPWLVCSFAAAWDETARALDDP